MANENNNLDISQDENGQWRDSAGNLVNENGKLITAEGNIVGTRIFNGSNKTPLYVNNNGVYINNINGKVTCLENGIVNDNISDLKITINEIIATNSLLNGKDMSGNHVNNEGILIDDKGEKIGRIFANFKGNNSCYYYLNNDNIIMESDNNFKVKGVDSNGKVEDSYLEFFYGEERANSIREERNKESQEKNNNDLNEKTQNSHSENETQFKEKSKNASSKSTKVIENRNGRNYYKDEKTGQLWDENNNLVNDNGDLINKDGDVVGKKIEKEGKIIYKNQNTNYILDIDSNGKVLGIDEYGNITDIDKFFPPQEQEKAEEIENNSKAEENEKNSQHTQQQQQENKAKKDNVFSPIGEAWKNVGKEGINFVGDTVIDTIGGVTEITTGFISSTLHDENNKAGIAAVGLITASVVCHPIAIGAGALTGINFIGRLVNKEEISLGTLAKSSADVVKQTQIITDKVCNIVVNAVDYVKDSSVEIQKANKEVLHNITGTGKINEQENEDQERE